MRYIIPTYENIVYIQGYALQTDEIITINYETGERYTGIIDFNKSFGNDYIVLDMSSQYKSSSISLSILKMESITVGNGNLITLNHNQAPNYSIKLVKSISYY